jgi:hypothetical protein
LVGELVEESVNFTVNGSVPVVTFDIKEATGADTLLTVIKSVFVTVWLPAVFVAVSETVYVPASEYVCDGFSSEAVLPSPNVHDQEVGELLDASMNATVSGTVPDVGVALKAATGMVSLAETGKMNTMTIKRVKIHRNGIIFFIIPPPGKSQYYDPNMNLIL